MKILITVFDIMDYGGIVNHLETLVTGFRELGHTADVIKLRNSTREHYVGALARRHDGVYSSVIAKQAHVTEGWYGMETYGYGNARCRKQYRKLTDQYDVVLHSIPCPALDPEGNWKKVFTDVSTPQYVQSHDAHFPKLYPHLLWLVPYIKGVFAVNPSSYHSLEHFPVPRVYSGHPIRDLHEVRSWRKRNRHWVAAHVWKPWKNMDLVIRAIPKLHVRDDTITHWIAGDGIVGRYMRSPTKCPEKWAGQWQRAVRAGLVWKGNVSASRVRHNMQQARAMVDMSYSATFAKYGAHPNASLYEAYEWGAVPVVIEDNMQSTLFENGISHIGLSWKEATPQVVARMVEHAINLKSSDAEDIIARGRKLILDYYHYRRVCNTHLRLFQGKTRHVGIYGTPEVGVVTPQLEEAMRKKLSRL